MGACASYCHGQNEEVQQDQASRQVMIKNDTRNHSRNSSKFEINSKDLLFQENDDEVSERNPGNGGGAPTSSDKMMDSNVRVMKGPQTLKYGAKYTG